MSLSVEQLITPVSTEVALNTLILILRDLGYPADSWQSGSIQRTILEMHAELYSEMSYTQIEIAKAGFNSLSTGGWLTLLSDSHYDNDRGDGSKTAGYVVLTDTANTGPHTIGVGEIVVSDVASNYRYRNTTAGTLPLGGTLSGGDALLFECEVIGSAPNVGNGQITVLVEGPPGVTVANPDPGTGTWITVNGANVESDAGLQARNRTKWATLTYSGPADAYENWARTAHQSVTRVFVDDQNPRGPGTLDVYIAGDEGDLTGPYTTPGTVCAAVYDYIQDGRRPLGANMIVLSAVERVIDVTGTVYCQPSADLAALELAVTEAIDAYFQAVPIGGTRSVDADVGSFLVGGLYHAMFSITGVVNVALSVPAANVTLLNEEVTVPNLALTYEFAAI